MTGPGSRYQREYTITDMYLVARPDRRKIIGRPVSYVFTRMTTDGFSAIPIGLWDWGIQRRTSMHRSYPEELIRLSVLPSDEATVTARGIRFCSCYYSCSRVIEEHWFEKARATRSWTVPIRYEPQDMNRIWLRDPKGRKAFIPCDLTDHSSGFCPDRPPLRH